MFDNRLCLNGNTVRTHDLARLTEIACEAGFAAAEIRLSSLSPLPHLPAELIDIIASLPPPLFFQSGAVFEQESKVVEEQLLCAAQIGCRLITGVVPADVPATSGVRRRLEKIRGACRKSSMDLAIEIVGPMGIDNRSQTEAHAQLADWQEWMAAHPGIKFVLDTFHIARARAFTTLEKVPERIGIVQMCDLSSDPLRAYEQDRCLPGFGRLPLARLVTALEYNGYRGYYSIELFPEDVTDPSLVAADAHQTLHWLLNFSTKSRTSTEPCSDESSHAFEKRERM